MEGTGLMAALNAGDTLGSQAGTQMASSSSSSAGSGGLRIDAMTYPIYWVNKLRGVVTRALLEKFYQVVSFSNESWIVDFLELKGMDYLLEVHENLFWTIYYHGTRRSRLSKEEYNDIHLLATRCIAVLFKSSEALAFLRGCAKKTVAGYIEQLVVSLASSNVEVISLVFTCLLTYFNAINDDTTRPGTKKGSTGSTITIHDVAQMFWDGLGALQLVSPEKSGFDGLACILLRNYDPKFRAQGIAVIHAAINGLYPQPTNLADIKGRIALRKKFMKTNLHAVIDPPHDTAAADPALATEIRKWKSDTTKDQEAYASEKEKKRRAKAELAALKKSAGGIQDEAGSSTEELEIVYSDRATPAREQMTNTYQEVVTATNATAPAVASSYIEVISSDTPKADLSESDSDLDSEDEDEEDDESAPDLAGSKLVSVYTEAPSSAPQQPSPRKTPTDGQAQSATTMDSSKDIYRYMKDMARRRSLLLQSSASSHNLERSGRKQLLDSDKHGTCSHCGPELKKYFREDIRSLALPIKRGNLFTWRIALKDNSLLGTPIPVVKFYPVLMIVDTTSVKITPMASNEDEIEAASSGAPLTAEVIPLEWILETREFHLGNAKEWDGKHGFIIRYISPDADQAIKREGKDFRVQLVATNAEDQQWWIRSITLNKAMHRDWNEEFQHVVELQREEFQSRQTAMLEEWERSLRRDGDEAKQVEHMPVTVSSPVGFRWKISSGERAKEWKRTRVKLESIVREFTHAAEVLGQIIIDELHAADKLIPPASQLGGVAGGEKYISHGILFKFARDHKGLYGGDEFAMKATSHEMKGLTAYIDYSLNSLFPNTLHFPIMTVIDYKGFRLSAVSILPVHSDATLVYGSGDAGRTIHNKYQEMNALMKKAGRMLNIKSHNVIPQADLRRGVCRRVHLCAPVDIEGHLGSDKRFYVLDTARVFPPTTPSADIRGSHLYRLFRPEFVSNFPVPLCSDAFTRWAHDPEDPTVLATHNDEVTAATNFLESRVVPEFALRLQTFFLSMYAEKTSMMDQVTAAEDSRILVIDLHSAGINVRYLGLVRTKIEEPTLRYWLLNELVARVLKNELRQQMRKVRSTFPAELRSVIVTFCYRIINDPAFWATPSEEDAKAGAFDVKKQLKAQFPQVLSKEEEAADWDFRANLHIPNLLLRLTKLVGIKFSDSFVEDLYRDLQAEGEKKNISMQQLEEALEKISPTITQLPLVSYHLAQRMEKIAGSARATTKKQKESLLQRAKDYYFQGLEMNSNDCDIRLSLASVLIRISQLIEEQITDTARGADLVRTTALHVRRYKRLAERQFSHVLRLDPSRVDAMSAYATYLSTFPERYFEADKYFIQALQADPTDENIKKLYEAHRGAGSSAAQNVFDASTKMPVPKKQGSLSQLQRKKQKSQGLLERKKSAQRRGTVNITSPATLNKKLQVTVDSARQLPAMDSNGFSDPYCTLSLGEDPLEVRTKVKKKTLNPEWKESFTFNITDALVPVKLMVYDWDRLSHDDFIGARVFNMNELLDLKDEDAHWYSLYDAPNGKPCPELGQVSVAFKWIS